MNTPEPQGIVEAIHIAPAATAPMVNVTEIMALRDYSDKDRP